MICPCRQKSRPQFKQNSHLDEQMGNFANGTIKGSDELWEVFLESQYGGWEEGCDERNEES